MSRKYCAECGEPHLNGSIGLCDACRHAALEGADAEAAEAAQQPETAHACRGPLELLHVAMGEILSRPDWWIFRKTRPQASGSRPFEALFLRRRSSTSSGRCVSSGGFRKFANDPDYPRGRRDMLCAKNNL